MNEFGDRKPPHDRDSPPAKLDRAEIDALMAIPPRPPPSIIVVGDEAVSAITLPRRA